MARITSLKQLQEVCDQVFETVKEYVDKYEPRYQEDGSIRYAHFGWLTVGKSSRYKDYLYISGGGSFIYDGKDKNAEISLDDLRYANKNGHSAGDIKKRAILDELKERFDKLFDRYF